jgi:AraC-like DNA-binding protein
MQELQAHTAETRVLSDSAAGQPDDPLLGRVRALVDERLAQGRPTKPWLAGSLGISTRTLARRLAERGTSVDDIVQQARARRTFELLANPAVAMYAVAIAAGYRGPASFYRAFRAWTGMTPAAYRAARLGGGAVSWSASNRASPGT